MKFTEFEETISPERMHRYVLACGNDTRRAMTLYRYNLKLSQEMFTLISCFEVSLRNRIDREMQVNFGADWLRISFCLEADSTQTLVLTARERSSKKHTKGLSVPTTIRIRNCWQKWSSAFGSSCTTMCSTAWLTAACWMCFLTNLHQRFNCNMTIHLCLENST